MSDQPPVAVPNTARGREAAAAANGTETRGEHFRRKAHRGRLHGYAIGGVALVAVLIALAASNTAQVKVSWLIGSSRVSLVWLVLAAAIHGWGLGHERLRGRPVSLVPRATRRLLMALITQMVSQLDLQRSLHQPL